MNRQNERKKLIALAHLAAKQLALDEDARRTVQLAVTGAASCRDMDEAALMRLLAHYKRKGADIYVPAARVVAAKDRAPLIAKIAAQCHALDVPFPAYALGIVRQMQGEAPAVIDWVPAPLLRKVVAALAYQQKRAGARTCD
ncbi:MAG: phage protein GemA/Gp16 family protein [Pseudomonadota bacterium]|uniref:phage protein GemA/Gp16 family protein n=1 Tax=Tepidiphilus succinatimandens TaxID=224436 RepID=UPI00112F260E|nr:phage protein GemA/Gp16 family protein [Tepidiphilus succinatimandens]